MSLSTDDKKRTMHLAKICALPKFTETWSEPGHVTQLTRSSVASAQISYKLLITSSHRAENVGVDTSDGLSTGCLGRAPRGLDKWDLNRLSGYKFRSTSDERAYRSSVPRARNELKSTLVDTVFRYLLNVKVRILLHFCRTPWGRASLLSSPFTHLTRGFVARWLFRVPPCRKGTMHLQTSLSSPEFDPTPYGTAVNIANHETGWVTF
ncbi:hypothetical protein TNCV_1233271 [Trichonephila clavipes]|nr:hypothetical protein TNCV_1233271 [Trichonephila clavipes]